MAQNQAKTQVMYETGHEELKSVQRQCKKGNCGRFCAWAIAN